MTVLKTPEDWQSGEMFTIQDADGWRVDSKLGAKDFNEPITREEFDQRLLECTLVHGNRANR